MLKKLIITINGKFYFIPSLYVIVFTFFAFLIAQIDYLYANGELLFIPSVLFIGNTLGGNILILIIGSILTILTVSFSIMLIVLTLYGNQLSPRSVQDFLENKSTLRIIGYYAGTLIFSIISLLTVQLNTGKALILSPTIGIGFLIFGIIVFINFMSLISKAIQVDIYIQNLVGDATKIIDTRQQTINDNPHIFIGKPEDYSEIKKDTSLDLMPEKSGFIQFYDENKLFEIAKNWDIVIFCEKKIGEHITNETPLMKIYSSHILENKDEVTNNIKKMVKIGSEPNLAGDLYTETSKLVEIALKALSPGINDPMTAITCIEKIGLLLHKAVINSEAKIYKDDNQQVRLILEGLTFEKLLFEHFYQIKHYGKDDLKILSAILSALNYISQNGTYEIKEQIWGFSNFLINDLKIESFSEIEKRYLYERFYQLSKATNCPQCLNDLFKI